MSLVTPERRTASPPHRIWNPQAECMETDLRRALQLELLREQVARMNRHCPYYAAKMQAAGIRPQEVQCLEDVARLPFTTKEDLRDHYPYGIFAVPLREVVRLHASTGTTGKPTVVGYTRQDMENWTEVVARFLVAGGLSDEDIVQIAFGYGLFTGGFGLHYGAERVGATVIPASSGNTERQIMILRDFGSTALVCTPTYAVYLAEALPRHGVDPSSLNLRVGFFGGEFWSEPIREKIQSLLGIVATDNYGLSEVVGPGVCGECLERRGMHIAEDHFLVEVVDPQTLAPLPDGETGEVVITTLTKQANPAIRYRTRDISRIVPGACACGRTTRRLARVTGRTDDMLIIRGVNVFPSQIEHVLLQFREAEPHYLLVVTREKGLDHLEVRVEVSQELFSDRMRRLWEIREALQQKIDNTLGVRAKLTLVEPGSLERFTGKAKRVLDLRNAPNGEQS
ncbi:MAG: phenylacetate--CoA ligase [Candidatus Sumerlaeia bacterium]|nr:phenylacetate--CoA ligase [Candidatus Sumerlaeia bacterium]